MARLSADGTRLEWSTLFGGDGSEEYAYDVELDAQGRPVIAGTAYGFTTTDFPATPGAYDGDLDPAFSEVFAARLAADGSGWSGPRRSAAATGTTGSALALDGQGDVHIAGATESTDFPTTPGAYDRVCNASTRSTPARTTPTRSRSSYRPTVPGCSPPRTSAVRVEDDVRAIALDGTAART